jgi:AcrR family transcriptional regulator
MRAVRTTRVQQAGETRERLFRAAVRLFARGGYHGTTIDQVAREARVAKGTFFLYFATKDAVITELVRLQTGAALQARADAKGTPVDRLRATVMTLGEQAGMNRKVSRAVLQATLSSPAVGGESGALFDQVFAEMIEDARDGQGQRLLSRPPDAETMASALMASYLGAALHFTNYRESPPLAEVLAPLVDANLRGFLNTDAQKEVPRATPRPRLVSRHR